MKRIIQEISAGAIIFGKKEGLEFLLFKNRLEDWEFPKGHLQFPNIEESAIIEVLEETGFDNINFIQGFHEKIFYVKEFDQEIAQKTVHFFLAEKDSKVKLSKEHSEYNWFKEEEALEVLFPEQKKLLKKVVKFVQQ